MNILKRLTNRPLGQSKKKSSLVKIVFFVLLFFIPLYPKFPLSAVSGTYVAIRLEDWVVLASLLVWGFWQFKKGFPIFRQKIFKLFALYWLVGLLSLLSALLITQSVGWQLGALHFIRRIEYMSLFFIAFDALVFTSLTEFGLGFGLVVFLVFVYGMGQKYLGLAVISTMNEEFSKGILLRLDTWTRISSTFAGHYDLASWLVMVLSFLPSLIFYFKKKVVKLWLFLVGAASFYLLVLTASRISFIAYLVGITTSLFLARKFRLLPFVLAASLFFGFQSKELNTRLASSLPLQVTQYSQRIAKVFKREPAALPTPTPAPIVIKEPTPVLIQKISAPTPIPEKEKEVVFREVRTWPKPEEVGAAAARSSQIRFQVEWPRAIRAFLKNPLLGTGYSSLGLATDNDYLRILGETGLLGFISFALIIFHLFKSGLKSLVSKNNLLMAGFLGVILGFCANAVFIDVFEASKDAYFFWLLMGVMYGIIANPPAGGQKLTAKSQKLPSTSWRGAGKAKN